jgi:hypothetical protein
MNVVPDWQIDLQQNEDIALAISASLQNEFVEETKSITTNSFQPVRDITPLCTWQIELQQKEDMDAALAISASLWDQEGKTVPINSNCSFQQQQPQNERNAELAELKENLFVTADGRYLHEQQCWKVEAESKRDYCKDLREWNAKLEALLDILPVRKIGADVAERIISFLRPFIKEDYVICKKLRSNQLL